jgi:hypothetical protein
MGSVSSNPMAMAAQRASCSRPAEAWADSKQMVVAAGSNPVDIHIPARGLDSPVSKA